MLAGCTGKSGAGLLADVLDRINGWQSGNGSHERTDLIVGLNAPDDAAVHRISDDVATVATVDFFAPIVDDPCAYGAISAANAMSDVYAMGAEVLFALNIAAFPVDLDESVIAEILRGGALKVAEAGGVVAGGHTVIDREPKYGLCVIGTVHPDRVLTKAGARPGDQLYLTKPLGTGLITTAAKFREADEEHLATATEWMSALNREASRIVRDSGAVAMTDVTGFGILGHAHEMASAGGVGFHFESEALPLLPGALDYAYRGIISGGGTRNRKYLEGKVSLSDEITLEIEHLLYDPQTSGGLLFAVSPDDSGTLEDRFREHDLPLWRVGAVFDSRGVTVT